MMTAIELEKLKILTINANAMKKMEGVTADKLIMVEGNYEPINTGFAAEMTHIGALYDPKDMKYYVTQKQLAVANEIVTSYFGVGSKIITPFQKKSRIAISEYTKNPDLEFGKDDDGVFVIDGRKLSGSNQQLTADLKRIGLRVTKIVNNTRIYYTKA